MVSWQDAKGAEASGPRKQIERLTISEKGTKIRLVGNVLPRYVYWVTTKEGKKIPVECLRFNRETESFNDSIPDPLKEVPEEIFSETPQFGYVCNVLEMINDKSAVRIFDLKKTIYNQIVSLAKDPEWGNPADPENGYAITVKKESTGPLPQNVKYTVLPGKNAGPLTEEQKKLELYDLEKIIKRPNYEEQKTWLLQNTSLFAHEADDSFKPEETPEDLG